MAKALAVDHAAATIFDAEDSARCVSATIGWGRFDSDRLVQYVDRTARSLRLTDADQRVGA